MERIGQVLAVLLLPVVATGVVLLAIGLFPADLPVNGNPSFIDTIFDNRGVILAARLLLVSAVVVLAFGGIFIVISVGIRMRNGDWLRRAGPFEISESTAHEVQGQVAFWRRTAQAAQQQIDSLSKQLDHADAQIRQVKSQGGVEWGSMRRAILRQYV
jgi:hypothetical protein